MAQFPSGLPECELEQNGFSVLSAFVSNMGI
ncbi:hypothetical protein EL76_5039 [Escherichia coli G3/10]|nr:hypothetical protein EL76_5039 [Escherichia coli G3/10]